MTIVLDGKKIAATILDQIKHKVAMLPEKPFLSIIRCGDDSASILYTTMKKKKAEDLGIKAELQVFSADTPEENIVNYIKDANLFANGIIVQLPLPPHLDQKKILAAIEPEKDVDGLTIHSALEVMQGNERHAPATPKGIMRLLAEYAISLAGKHVVVVGRSDLIGKPTALMALYRDATVSICHSKTKNLANHTRQADILISAVGKPHFITADMIQDSAIVIDVGISQLQGETRGDIHPDAARKASFIAPVPGGIGPMTIAMLLEAVVEAKIYKNEANRKERGLP
ncbi:MAG TPA: bifunctional 5,10-methylenetetrahydrofolate dehydrogenase/5,10-methenyltetrahydrofolate cyclohydrolase [Candidatus Nanoarchaeia archaeon]|nr:bifunctional 5,10-methylenetetrahydrofolate dehydrogenase/5,10-methenyltetrahydrofolate cyclohydrolase [Candidatus Nanoarchaeia archaeon]